MSYRHAVIHVYLFIRLWLIFLSVLSSSWCAGSAVSLTLVLAVLAIVLVQAALDFKNNSVRLQHFSPPASSALWDFSFSPLAPCVSWCLDSFSAGLISVNFQLSISNFQQARRRVYSSQSLNSQKALLHFNFCKQIMKFKKKKCRQICFISDHACLKIWI